MELTFEKFLHVSLVVEPTTALKRDRYILIRNFSIVSSIVSLHSEFGRGLTFWEVVPAHSPSGEGQITGWYKTEGGVSANARASLSFATASALTPTFSHPCKLRRSFSMGTPSVCACVWVYVRERERDVCMGVCTWERERERERERACVCSPQR